MGEETSPLLGTTCWLRVSTLWCPGSSRGHVLQALTPATVSRTSLRSGSLRRRRVIPHILQRNHHQTTKPQSRRRAITSSTHLSPTTSNPHIPAINGPLGSSSSVDSAAVMLAADASFMSSLSCIRAKGFFGLYSEPAFSCLSTSERATLFYVYVYDDGWAV